MFSPGFGPVVCRSSCPFPRCECRLPSNASWSATSHPTPMSQTRPSNRPLLPPPPSFRLTQPAPPALLLLLDLTQAGYLAGSCGLHSSSNRSLSLRLSFISPCPLPIYFLSPPSPTVPLVPAAQPLPINRTATRHVLNGSAGTAPAGPLSPGRVVIWWFCLRHGGGIWKAFETTEESCCVSFEAAHYNQDKWRKLKPMILKLSRFL